MAIVYHMQKYRNKQEDYRDPPLKGQKYTFRLSKVVDHVVMTTLEYAREGTMVDPKSISSIIQLEIRRIQAEYEQCDITF